MSTSLDNQPLKIPGLATAITGEILFLLNLLLPVLPLLFLIFLNLKHRGTTNDFLRAHLKQPLIAAIISTSLFLLGILFIVMTGGYKSISIQLIVVLEVYTLIVVIPMLIPGLIGVIKAMSGENYRYPLIGRLLDA